MILISTDDSRLVATAQHQALGNGVHLIHAHFNQLLELARTRAPSAIIVDFQQRLDARLIVNSLRSHWRTAAIPIVAVFGTLDEKLNTFCREHRVAHIDLKPILPTMMRRVAKLQAPPAPRLSA